jgi:hypothetical protein
MLGAVFQCLASGIYNATKAFSNASPPPYKAILEAYMRSVHAASITTLGIDIQALCTAVVEVFGAR